MKYESHSEKTSTDESLISYASVDATPSCSLSLVLFTQKGFISAGRHTQWLTDCSGRVSWIKFHVYKIQHSLFILAPVPYTLLPCSQHSAGIPIPATLQRK